MNLIKICTTTKKFSSVDEIVPAWVPIPPIKPEPSNFFYLPPPPSGNEKLINSPQADKTPR